jgi:hypothetical protein
VSLLVGLAVAAAGAPPVDPGWAVNGSGSRCALSRSADAQTLMLRTFPGTGDYDLILVAPALAKLFQGPRPKPFSLVFAPAGTVFHRIGAPLPLKADPGVAVAFNGLQRDTLDDMAKATALAVDVDRTEIATFPLPLADKAVAALAYCEQAKLEEWGADTAGFAPGASQAKPVGNPAMWLTAKDLGKAGKGNAGFAALRLAIAPDGSISGCTPLETNNPALDTLACPALTPRARYEPARDAAGHPVKSVVIYIASWPCPDCVQVDAIG